MRLFVDKHYTITIKDPDGIEVVFIRVTSMPQVKVNLFDYIENRDSFFEANDSYHLMGKPNNHPIMGSIEFEVRKVKSKQKDGVIEINVDNGNACSTTQSEIKV